MTPKQVQFCYAVAHAKAELAGILASRIDINQNNDWGCSPTLMCLWALNHDPKTFVKKLEEFFPKPSNYSGRVISTSKDEMEITIRQLVLPLLLKRSLNQLLIPIGLKVVSLDKMSNSKQDHFVKSASAAVNLIIQDECFNNINESQRRFAEVLLDKLHPIVEKMNAEAKTIPQPKPHTAQQSKQQPYTIQLLMAILNGKSQPNMPSLNLATLEPIGRSYLPGALSKKSAPSNCHSQVLQEEEEHKYHHRMAPVLCY